MFSVHTCSPNCRLRVMDFRAFTIWAFVAEGLSSVSRPIPSRSFRRYGTSSTLRACSVHSQNTYWYSFILTWLANTILKKTTVYLGHQFSLLLLEHAIESFTSQSGHVGPTFHPRHEGADGLQRSHGAYTQLHRIRQCQLIMLMCHGVETRRTEAEIAWLLVFSMSWTPKSSHDASQQISSNLFLPGKCQYPLILKKLQQVKLDSTFKYKLWNRV